MSLHGHKNFAVPSHMIQDLNLKSQMKATMTEAFHTISNQRAQRDVRFLHAYVRNLDYGSFINWLYYCNCTVVPREHFFLRPSFWISLNIFRSTCRTTLIFLPLDRAMLEQHFSYLGHAHICSRKFSRRTWKKVFVKKFTFFRLFGRKFWLCKVWKKWIFWRKIFSSPPRNFSRADMGMTKVWKMLL